MNLTERRPVNVGLIGFGNIGTGVVRYFQEGRGEPFNVHLRRVAVADLSKPRTVQFSPLTDKPADILRDPTIDIVVELMGGVDLARQYTLDAIDSRKSVVNANKALLARHMKEIFDAARSGSVNLAFEASVGGGIPIINILNRFRGERITKVMGILNGTTNYILTQMEEGLDFETALGAAQENGFAETNHILDTGGYDTRDKLAVLASLIFNTQVDVERIACKGITDITPIDIDFAAKYGVEEGGRGYAVKLLAVAQRQKEAVELRVGPAIIRKDHPLASARNEFNSIYLEGELAGPQTFSGKGAGTNPTTSAIISDILRVAGNIRHDVLEELPTLDSPVQYVEKGGTQQRGYIRVNLKHEPGSIAAISNILSEHRLNIEDSVQRKRFATPMDGGTFIPDIITIEAASRATINSALEKIALSDRVHGTPFFLSFEI